ncbi:hypothetical protein D3C71_1249470 [compost metagenome]
MYFEFARVLSNDRCKRPIEILANQGGGFLHQNAWGDAFTSRYIQSSAEFP